MTVQLEITLLVGLAAGLTYFAIMVAGELWEGYKRRHVPYNDHMPESVRIAQSVRYAESEMLRGKGKGKA